MRSTLNLALLATLLFGCTAPEPIRDDARIARSCLNLSHGGSTIDTLAAPHAHPSQCIRLSVDAEGNYTADLFGEPCTDISLRVRSDGRPGTEWSGTVIARAVTIVGTTDITEQTRTTRPYAHDVVADFGEGGIFHIVGEGIASSEDEDCRVTPQSIQSRTR